jgi:hypothetical protein
MDGRLGAAGMCVVPAGERERRKRADERDEQAQGE